MNGQQKRYSVTLNAPTTAVKTDGDQLTSHIDQNTVYNLSILDTAPIHDEDHQYHSVVRVCLDDALQESCLPQHTAPKEPSNANLCTIEYAPLPQEDGGSSHILPTLHSCLEKSFSVTWSSNSVTGGSYCHIPIKLRNLSSQGYVSLMLFVGTERIQMIDATLSRAEQYEESFACVRLFKEGDAQDSRAAEVTDVEHQITELQRAIEQARITSENTILAQTSEDEALHRSSESEKHTTRKRKAPMNTHPIPACTKEHASLTSKLCSARKRLAAVRTVQVFRPVASAQGEQAFHMPSQQTKFSNSSAQITRKYKESKHTKIPSASISRSVLKRPERIFYNTSASFKVSGKTADIAKRRLTAPVVCFYVRPEHLPTANYTAIYLLDQDFPSLLSAISSKLQTPMDMIGTIYYYDQNMAPVVVNEITIRSAFHEQDFIVRLPWVAKEFPEHSAEEQHHTPFTAETFDGRNNVFDQYLTLPLEVSYAPSVGSWSESTDDTSMSTGHMFAQSTTLSPENGIHYEERHQGTLHEQGIDYASYAFDAIPNAVFPMVSLSNTPTQSTLRLVAPILGIPQTSPPQAETLQRSASECRLIEEAAPSVNEELAELATDERVLSLGYSPSVSRTTAVPRPSSLRTHRRPPHVETVGRLNDKISTSNKGVQDVNYALERNRLAAMKCRATRKGKETRLKDLSKQKLEINVELRDEIRCLEAEIREAKGLLKMHVACA